MNFAAGEGCADTDAAVRQHRYCDLLDAYGEPCLHLSGRLELSRFAVLLRGYADHDWPR